MRFVPFLLIGIMKSATGLLVRPARVKSFKLFSSGHMPQTNVALRSEEEAVIANFKNQQAALPRPSFADEVKTLIDQSIGFGVLSTNSVQYPGFPTGSVVGFQTDRKGLPFFSFSTMSAHTTDLMKDGRASLTVMARNFQGAAEGRVVLVGRINLVQDSTQVDALRSLYKARHKDAYWIDFGYVP